MPALAAARRPCAPPPGFPPKLFHLPQHGAETAGAYQPEYIAAIFESGKTFPRRGVRGYKANRTEMPPDLGEQIPYIRRLLEAMRIPVLQYAGFEADDVIGAMARRASEKFDVVIVSSDKDMLQLVDERVHMYNPVKEDVWYDPA
jgi:DNA polymerase-1